MRPALLKLPVPIHDGAIGGAGRALLRGRSQLAKTVLHCGAGAEVRGAAFALAHVLVCVRMKYAGEHFVDVSVKIVTSHSKHP